MLLAVKTIKKNRRRFVPGNVALLDKIVLERDGYTALHDDLLLLQHALGGGGTRWVEEGGREGERRRDDGGIRLKKREKNNTKSVVGVMCLFVLSVASSICQADDQGRARGAYPAQGTPTRYMRSASASHAKRFQDPSRTSQYLISHMKHIHSKTSSYKYIYGTHFCRVCVNL